MPIEVPGMHRRDFVKVIAASAPFDLLRKQPSSPRSNWKHGDKKRSIRCGCPRPDRNRPQSAPRLNASVPKPVTRRATAAAPCTAPTSRKPCPIKPQAPRHKS